MSFGGGTDRAAMLQRAERSTPRNRELTARACERRAQMLDRIWPALAQTWRDDARTIRSMSDVR